MIPVLRVYWSAIVSVRIAPYGTCGLKLADFLQTVCI
jgi:hypothetical protein